MVSPTLPVCRPFAFNPVPPGNSPPHTPKRVSFFLLPHLDLRRCRSAVFALEPEDARVAPPHCALRQVCHQLPTFRVLTDTAGCLQKQLYRHALA